MSGPLPEVLAPLTVPASWMYERIIALRNARFDRGQGVQRIDRPVISIGNITTGGTGKTPMVMWIARKLLDAGFHPAIAMRGYRSSGGVSDEQAEYVERLPDVHVLAHPNRFEALRSFLPLHPQVDCVLLDDGFQHRQLHRDLDLVLIDVTAGTFRDRMLPAGNLREPLDNLRRADAVIATRADEVQDDFAQAVARFHGKPLLAWAHHRWRHVDVHDRAGSQCHEVDWLRRKRVLTMLGVGNPKAVIRQLEEFGAHVAVNIPCSDHERYHRAKLAVARGLATGCGAVVVTGKDWVKLRDLIDWSIWPVPIVVPRLEMDVFEGADRVLDLVFSKVRAVTAGEAAR